MARKKTRIWLIGVFSVLLLFISWYFSNILIYAATAIILSLVLSPVKNGLKKLQINGWRLPDWLCALVSIWLLLAAFTTLILAFAPLIFQQIIDLTQIDARRIQQNIEPPLRIVYQALESSGMTDEPELYVREAFIERINAIFNLKSITGIFNTLVGFTGEFFVAFFATLFMLFFFLKESYLLRRIIFLLTPREYLFSAKNIISNTESLLKRYFIGLLFQILGITLVAYLGLTVFNIKNALLIGFFAGIMNIIPFLGPFLGASFGLLITFATELSIGADVELLTLFLKIAGTFIVVQLTDNLIFQPVIFSNSVKAHPLEIFVLILMAARLGGIPAMIVAIPAYTILRLILKEFLSEFRFVKALTGRL